MQELRIERVERKQPRKEGGNPFFVVRGQAGEEMTSFDTKLEPLGRGSLINVEPKIIWKDGKQHINIVKWELIEEVKAGASPAAGSAPRSLDDREIQLRKAEMLSAELRTVFTGILELKIASRASLNERELNLYEVALDWAESRLGKTSKPPSMDEDWEKLDRKSEEADDPVKNVGDLLTRAHKRGLSRTDVMSKARVQKVEDLEEKDLDDLWEEVKKRAPKLEQ